MEKAKHRIKSSKYKAKHGIKSSNYKFYLVTIVSFGFLIFGVLCICWATINIWKQSMYYSAEYSSSTSTLPTFVVTEKASVPPDDTVSTEAKKLFNINDSDKNLYPNYPAEGDIIGNLSIPVLERKLPIIQGTGADELKKGVGHYIQSALPGEEDNSVLSGHRETVFTQVGDLKIGDLLIVQTSAGIFTYEVNGARIVHADDKTVIVTTDHAVLTLTTCYPFNFIGSAPDRYIITADLVMSE